MAKAFYRVEVIPFEGREADPNGKHYDIQFADGYAYVSWKEFGEHETEVAIQALGHDPRFRVTEILENEIPESEPKREADNAVSEQETESLSEAQASEDLQKVEKRTRNKNRAK